MNWLYRFLSARNDVRAARKAYRTRSDRPVVMRQARKVATRSAGRAINRLFR